MAVLAWQVVASRWGQQQGAASLEDQELYVACLVAARVVREAWDRQFARDLPQVAASQGHLVVAAGEG